MLPSSSVTSVRRFPEPSTASMADALSSYSSPSLCPSSSILSAATNAISSPSGDQEGWNSSPGLSVRRSRSPLRRSSTQMS